MAGQFLMMGFGLNMKGLSEFVNQVFMLVETHSMHFNMLLGLLFVLLRGGR